MVLLQMTHRAAVPEATSVVGVDEIQSPKLLRLWILPIDETFRSLLHRCPCSINISWTKRSQHS